MAETEFLRGLELAKALHAWLILALRSTRLEFPNHFECVPDAPIVVKELRQYRLQHGALCSVHCRIYAGLPWRGH